MFLSAPAAAACRDRQRTFKAKPVPAHVHEARVSALTAAYEATKLAAKVKAEMARQRAAHALEKAQQLQRWVVGRLHRLTGCHAATITLAGNHHRQGVLFFSV